MGVYGGIHGSHMDSARVSKGNSSGIYEASIRILLRVLWWFYGNFYRGSMMNPMGSASWILCRIPWISMNPIGVSRRLLEGIPWGF